MVYKHTFQLWDQNKWYGLVVGFIWLFKTKWLLTACLVKLLMTQCSGRVQMSYIGTFPLLTNYPSVEKPAEFAKGSSRKLILGPGALWDNWLPCVVFQHASKCSLVHNNLTCGLRIRPPTSTLRTELVSAAAFIRGWRSVSSLRSATVVCGIFDH